MKKIYVVFVLLVLALLSGCITEISTRKEGDVKKDIVMGDLFNQSLKDRGLGEKLEDLHIDSREIDIKQDTNFAGGRIVKTEILKGSKACLNFEITITYRDDEIYNFNIRTWDLDDCFIQGN